MNPIRFKFSAEKARAAIHWMVASQPGIDLHALLKACYFADKEHLNAYGRPVFGARYRAMRFGPVPVEIYEMAKGEPIWLAELGLDAMPWRTTGYKMTLVSNQPPDMDCLSDSDVGAITRGFEKSVAMSFDARTEATHGPDWQAARLGMMSYEDMIEDTPNKEALVAYLRETARFIRI